MAAASDDEHGCALGCLEQSLGGTALAHLQVQPGRRVTAEGGPDCLVENLPMSRAGFHSVACRRPEQPQGALRWPLLRCRDHHHAVVIPSSDRMNGGTIQRGLLK